MGKRLLLEVSPTGVQHFVEVDEDGFTYQEHQSNDVERGIIDECQKLRGLHQNRQSNFRLAAKIPLVTHQLWKKEWREKYSDTWTWQTFLAMKINSGEYSKLDILEKSLPTTQNRRMI